MSRPQVSQWTESGEYPGYQLRVSREDGILWLGIRKGDTPPVYSLPIPSSYAEDLNAYVHDAIRSRIADMESGNADLV